MLTKKQKELLLFINDRMQEGEIAPSFDEMREALVKDQVQHLNRQWRKPQ